MNMARNSFTLAVVAALAMPITAMAGPEDDEAEYKRLSSELKRHAERNTYAGMERAYQALSALKNVTLSAEDHRLGAAAARNAGNVTAMVDRTRLAEAVEGSAEGEATIADIEGNYGTVDLKSKQGTAELILPVRPFQPDHGAAFDFAAAAIVETGKYEGWLPAGDYTFGEEGFSIAAGGEPFELDLRKVAPVEKPPEECSGDTTSDQLMTSLDAANGSWNDPEAIKVASDQARFDLPCFHEKAYDNPHLIAEYHRVEGLRHYAEGNPEPASLAWASARLIEPSYSFATLPEGDAARDVYTLENIKKLETEEVTPPAKGHIRFDGRATLNRPLTPSLVQMFDDTGAVTYTGYHLAGDLPSYKALPEGEKSSYRYEGTGSLRGPLLAGAGLAAIGGGVVYTMALGAKTKFGESETFEDGSKLQAQANTLGATGLALGGVALGLGVGAMFTGSF